MDTKPTTNASGKPALTNGAHDASLTPIEALAKIEKILDKLVTDDRKRVLEFLRAEPVRQ